MLPISLQDLRKLGEIAAEDRSSLFRRKLETGRLYEKRLFAVALCQGAALHYLDLKNGIKDFDVWSFYEEQEERAFPYRRRAEVDFGESKFGVTEGYEHFIGRRVDLIGRSISLSDHADPVKVLRGYLQAGKTKSARRLAEKAVILIEPPPFLGTVVWPT